jgi:hypothetical protein
MANFYWNPNSSQPNPGVPVVLTEAQWRVQIARWVDQVDVLEANLVANVGVNWFRTPDGDYWTDVNAAPPPAFTPPASNAANAAMLTTDTTTWSADTLL